MYTTGGLYYSALHIAADLGLLEITKMLIQKGADVDAQARKSFSVGSVGISVVFIDYNRKAKTLHCILL